MQHVRCGAFDVSETAKQRLKNIALVFGLLSAATMVFDFYRYMMFFSLLFCTIWINCTWRRSEPQLKWINIIFLPLWIRCFLVFLSRVIKPCSALKTPNIMRLNLHQHDGLIFPHHTQITATPKQSGILAKKYIFQRVIPVLVASYPTN